MELNLNEVLTNLVLAVIIAAIPAVIAFVRPLIQQQLAKLKLEIGERNYWLLQSFARDLVAAAEQTIGDNADKKAYAVRMLHEMAQSAGLDVTLEQVAALVEAAVHELKNGSGPTLEIVNNG